MIGNRALVKSDHLEALQCNKERGEESQIFRESFEGWIKRVDTIDNDIEENVNEVSQVILKENSVMLMTNWKLLTTV